MTCKGIACAALCLTLAARAVAQPVPAHEATPKTKVWLGRALVGESGWENRDDQAAVAWVLAKRWRQRLAHRPAYRFVTMVRQYASPVKPPSPRPWVRNLPADGRTRPRGWSSSIGWWDDYAPQWRAVLSFVDRWSSGLVEDPTPRANHYGSTTDPHPTGWYQVRSSGSKLLNIFYVGR